MNKNSERKYRCHLHTHLTPQTPHPVSTPTEKRSRVESFASTQMTITSCFQTLPSSPALLLPTKQNFIKVSSKGFSDLAVLMNLRNSSSIFLSFRAKLSYLFSKFRVSWIIH